VNLTDLPRARQMRIGRLAGRLLEELHGKQLVSVKFIEELRRLAPLSRRLYENGVDTEWSRDRQRYCLKRVREGATFRQVGAELKVSYARASQIAARGFRLEREAAGDWRGWDHLREQGGLWFIKAIRESA